MNDFGLLVAQYNASLPTLTDGQYTELQVDSNGRLLVQADVTVLIDFLGLNGASDSANILIVGTEDGTSGGTPHAVRVDTGGQVVISDGGGSITVDGTVAVTATDLDIRDLDASQDNVAISDGTDTLAVNADGSINSVVSATDLDIRDLSQATDSVAIGDGTDIIAINADGSINITDNGGSITVDAVDLDIRDLSSASDSVQSDLHDGSGTAITSTGGALDVNVASGNITVDLDHTEDSVRLGDGTSFFTSTSENSDIALDVHISNSNIEVTQGTSPWVVGDGGGSLTVDAVDLDIRDIDASQDNIAISDGTDTLAVNADGSINSVVTATDLDIRQLVHTGGTPDSVQIGDGTEILLINADGSINITDNGGSITVDAVDLDIRDLSASQDSVAISDGTDTLEVNADGSINVAISAAGSEQYSVTDALAAAGDGLETITAAATPWVTVASYSHTSGTAYVYGYQFAADQNVQARLVTNDGSDDVVYKTSVNSSAMPSVSEHFSEGGRIEIPGAASLEIRLQLKKRSTPGGNAQGTGSMHIRTV